MRCLVIQCARDADGLPDLKLPKPTITLAGRTITVRPVEQHGPGLYLAEWDGHSLVIHERDTDQYVGTGTDGARDALRALGVDVEYAADVKASTLDSLRAAGVSAVQRKSDGEVVTLIPDCTFGGDPMAVALADEKDATEEYRAVRALADETKPWEGP